MHTADASQDLGLQLWGIQVWRICCRHCFGGRAADGLQKLQKRYMHWCQASWRHSPAALPHQASSVKPSMCTNRRWPRLGLHHTASKPAVHSEKGKHTWRRRFSASAFWASSLLRRSAASFSFWASCSSFCRVSFSQRQSHAYPASCRAAQSVQSAPPLIGAQLAAGRIQICKMQQPPKHREPRVQPRLAESADQGTGSA